MFHEGISAYLRVYSSTAVGVAKAVAGRIFKIKQSLALNKTVDMLWPIKLLNNAYVSITHMQ